MTLMAASWRRAGLHAFLALGVFVLGAGGRDAGGKPRRAVACATGSR